MDAAAFVADGLRYLFGHSFSVDGFRCGVDIHQHKER
jgi:hypothetical protein